MKHGETKNKMGQLANAFRMSGDEMHGKTCNANGKDIVRQYNRARRDIPNLPIKRSHHLNESELLNQELTIGHLEEVAIGFSLSLFYKENILIPKILYDIRNGFDFILSCPGNIPFYILVDVTSAKRKKNSISEPQEVKDHKKKRSTLCSTQKIIINYRSESLKSKILAWWECIFAGGYTDETDEFFRLSQDIADDIVERVCSISTPQTNQEK